MIIYDPSRRVGLAEFGIEIPVLDARAVNTLAHLKSHPELGKRIDQWHIARITETIGREDLLRVHSPEYVARLYSDGLEAEIVRTYELLDAEGNFYRYNPQRAELPLSALFERTLATAAGTYHCCRTALERGFCYFFGGGTHHARRDTGSGFCLVNDIVIALRRLQAEQAIGSAWVIDVDAHKGDGTAALTEGDASVRTLSIHMAHGWPLDSPPVDSSGSPNPSHIPSDVDIPMAPGEDALYVARLEAGLERLASLSRPDLAVVVAGADPFEGDALPSTQDLRLSLDQLLERDRLVYRFLEARGIPQAFLMAGGYGDDTWKVYAQFLEWVLLRRWAMGDEAES
jgi:acetoin utilization deacetylase AcuC-like enzyme